MAEIKIVDQKIPEFIHGIPLINIYIIKDNNRYMAKCPELDIITEMDTSEAALNSILEMLKEYAEDYKNREKLYTKSPNRAHHKPYVDKIMGCKDKWALYELIIVKYGHVYI